MLIALGTYGSGIHWPKTLSHKVDVNEYPYMHLTGIYGARFLTIAGSISEVFANSYKKKSE